MHVRVLFFGMLKDVVGKGSDSLTLPAGATLADLLACYQSEFPRLQQFLPSLALSINREYAAAGQPLHDNDEVALLPPVSGGAAAAEPLVLIVRERIVPHEIVPPLEKPEDGAIVVFDGVARNQTRGRKTLYLDYEAYEPMALGELRRLAGEALEKFPIRNLALVHR